MNILFYTFKQVVPTIGGIERVTDILASALTAKGVNCFSAYTAPADGSPSNAFSNAFLASDLKSDIRKIVIDNHIDVIVNQSKLNASKQLRAAINGLDCRLVFAHHFAPAWEENILNFASTREKLNEPGLFNKCKAFAHILLFPLRKLTDRHKWRQWYKESLLASDIIVLLSNGYVKTFLDYCGASSVQSDKIRVIHNPLTFNVTTQPDLQVKQNVVLIVARLHDVQKRISLALKIWDKVMKSGSFPDWHLTIVGDGPDRAIYEKLIASLSIPNVDMVGFTDPRPYYENAKLFMMTSASEAWGMTLIESLQFSVVPVVFDTYAALHDIINDASNGFIVDEGDIDEYASRLSLLMKDDSLRQSMALNGPSSIAKFNSDSISSQWTSLFNEIVR
ncbi:MAG: glycosyltransferase [Bacteroidales bacterium]|nr:glycosyltransferase [Bacteroidales bacterium]